MGAYVSIVGRQRNESCNVKEFLQSRPRMVALFEDIAEYSKEMLNLRNVRNKVSLEALLLFMQNKRDVFIAINFFPPNLSGASMSSLISACFYYSIKREDDPMWCRLKKQNKNKHDLTFEVFSKLMTALFCFSHLFELFIACDNNVTDENIFIGEFLRAKNKLMLMPGIELKHRNDYDNVGGELGPSPNEWQEEFLKMESGVNQNDSVCFHEFCQYAVRELITPELYLERYKKKAYDPYRPPYPPRYDRSVSYNVTLLQYKMGLNPPPQSKQLGDSELISKFSSKLPPALEHRPKQPERPMNECDKSVHEEDASSSCNSISVLFTSRGRIRPDSAPPPNPSSALHLTTIPCVPAGKALLKPTVFNGRHILSTKRAQKKKYNTFHQFKLDPNMDSNYIPQILPKQLPAPGESLSPPPKRVLVPTYLQFSGRNIGKNTTTTVMSTHHLTKDKNMDYFNDNLSSFSSLEAAGRKTLHLQVKPPLQKDTNLLKGLNTSATGLDVDQPSVCFTVGDSVTMCDLSVNRN